MNSEIIYQNNSYGVLYWKEYNVETNGLVVKPLHKRMRHDDFLYAVLLKKSKYKKTTTKTNKKKQTKKQTKPIETGVVQGLWYI